MDGNGGCCIARWSDGGHVAAGYDATKMDRIMLKFRPIAPKPVAANGAGVATSDSSNGSPRGSSHAKGAGRGRRKSMSKENNNNNNNKRGNNNSGRKRKSNSPDQRFDNAQGQDHHLSNGYYDVDVQDHNGSVTLLPLFPEAPDLSPTKQANNMPIRLEFNNNNPVFVDNYNFCHGQGW